MQKLFKIKTRSWKAVEKGEHSIGPVVNYEVETDCVGLWFLWAFDATAEGIKCLFRKSCDSLAHGKELAEADWLARISPALEEVQPETGASLTALTLAYTAGYRHGHESTVEGYYSHVMERDSETYYADEVAEMAREGAFGKLIQPEPDRELLALAEKLAAWDKRWPKWSDTNGTSEKEINALCEEAHAIITSAERRMKP